MASNPVSSSQVYMEATNPDDVAICRHFLHTCTSVTHFQPVEYFQEDIIGEHFDNRSMSTSYEWKLQLEVPHPQ